MKIEEVEALADQLDQVINDFKVINYRPILQAIEALRAEVWYPTKKAEEMGAKDGRELLMRNRYGKHYLVSWDGSGWWSSDGYVDPTDDDQCEFKRINPPEGS